MYITEKAGQTRKSRMILNAAGGLFGLGLLNSAIALPPPGRGSSSLPANESAITAMVAGRAHLREPDTIKAPLDLRLRQGSLSPIMHEDAGTFASAAFPSAIHQLELGKADFDGEGRDAEERTRSSTVGARVLNFQELSQAQVLAQRIQRMHREGLPLAHLWESQSASLSIGLNQRGKPGVWFTQKVH